MLHPDTELRRIDHRIGYGVFATRPIARGTITWVPDMLDQVFEPARAEELIDCYGDLFKKFTFVDGLGQRVLCWDFGRFMNHSCEPNILTCGFEIEVAIRDIRKGDQLTNDYASFNLERPFECRCGNGHCRGVVRPEDYDKLAAGWDAALRDAFPLIHDVHQPLWHWVARKKTIERWIADPRRIPPALSHRFAPVDDKQAALSKKLKLRHD